MISYTASANATLKIATIDGIDYLRISHPLGDSPSLSLIGGDDSIGNEAVYDCDPLTVLSSPEDLKNLTAAAKVVLQNEGIASEDKEPNFLNDPGFCLRYREAMLGDLSDWYLYAIAIQPRDVRLYYSNNDTFETINLNLSSIPLVVSVPEDEKGPAQKFKLVGASDVRRYAVNIKVYDEKRSSWLPAVLIEESRNPNVEDRTIHRYYPLEGMSKSDLRNIMNRRADDGASLRW